MEWLCGLLVVLGLITVVGHLIWVTTAAILSAIFGPEARAERLPRPFRYCPACGTETDDRDWHCTRCHLELDGRLARDLHRIHVAEREVRALLKGARIDPEAASQVLNQLEARARSLQGLPANKPEPKVLP